MADQQRTPPARRVLVQIPATGQVIEVTGRAALMVLLICQYAVAINNLLFGHVELHFTPHRVTGSLADRWETVHLDESA